jgi:tetratricopeptide (TPR) repeat protein
MFAPMSLPRSAGTTRRRRTLEILVLLALVACLALVLGPIAREKAREHAQRQARAEEILNQANSVASKVRRLAPAYVGVTYSAAAGAPLGEILEKMAPIEIESLNEQLVADPNNVELLAERARLHEQARNPQARLADLDRILTLQPDDGWIRQQRDELWEELKSSPKTDSGLAEGRP